MTTDEPIFPSNLGLLSRRGNTDTFDPVSFNLMLRQPRFVIEKIKQCLDEDLMETTDSCEQEHLSAIEKFKGRSSSPPPLFRDQLIVQSGQNQQCNSSSVPKRPSTGRCSLPLPPILVPTFQRSKSHSMKLTRMDLLDSSPKKTVHFADDIGFVLTQTKVIIADDEFPSVPSTAFEHLQRADQPNKCERTKIIHYMEAQFENPVSKRDFDERVTRQKISLEQANAIDNRIYGTVKSLSSSSNKPVRIRLTTDNWMSFRDYDATHIPNSSDGTSDRFSFTIEIDQQTIRDGNTIQFCVCYEPFDGSEYWDNNNQENYRFKCLSRTTSAYGLETDN